MYTDIDIKEALSLSGVLLVDVRSEEEYLRDTIPGAVNIPVLHNEEKAAVGLIYHREGAEAALKLGINLVTPKLAAKLAAVSDLSDGRALVVFCWRGGQRSDAMARFLAQEGYAVYRLIGGYKAYRRYVLEYLSNMALPLRSIVLHGLTGTGKTDILEKLAARGLPVLDLEGLARHRGSVYCKIGLPPSPSQKAFESQIVNVLEKAAEQGLFLVECESRRLGNLLTPQLVMDFIRQGAKVLLYCALPWRIKRIRDVYAGSLDENIAALQQGTAALSRMLGKAKVEELGLLLAEKEYDQVIAFMLEHHYDPLYNYPSRPEAGYELCVDTGCMEEAVEIIYGFAIQIRNEISS